ncbi:HIT family protein [Ectobacillus antri]|uniref:HIT family protein n=1 Tax=Ectobacillus antri TaxID=2486280 RepID=A0ABT6H6B0_9BACI|nr:HIT family protein [Ectobacillus antri]MDG4657757.1 HIT family protein [Ectobacillus antri]MDG5754764.1 HIT family protein [Ectobacillus antri]
MECFGCRLAHQQESVHMVYEDEWVCCILDHDSFNEGHVLILPKAHVEDMDELDALTGRAVLEAAQRLTKAVKMLYRPDGVTICQNGGIFSELTHFHVHVVPRYEGQDFAAFYQEAPFKNEEIRSRLGETKEQLAAFLQEHHFQLI